MLHKESELNAYKIHHATFVPVKGFVTKNDWKSITGMQCVYAKQKECGIHGPSELSVMDKVAKISMRGLGKPYTVYIYTDKQFGMRKFKDSVQKVLTSKQLLEAVTV